MIICHYFYESGDVDMDPDTDMKTLSLLKGQTPVLQIWILSTIMHLNNFSFQGLECRQSNSSMPF